MLGLYSLGYAVSSLNELLWQVRGSPQSVQQMHDLGAVWRRMMLVYVAEKIGILIIPKTPAHWAVSGAFLG